jgi:hypothetical protein
MQTFQISNSKRQKHKAAAKKDKKKAKAGKKKTKKTAPKKKKGDKKKGKKSPKKGLTKSMKRHMSRKDKANFKKLENEKADLARKMKKAETGQKKTTKVAKKAKEEDQTQS